MRLEGGFRLKGGEQKFCSLWEEWPRVLRKGKKKHFVKKGWGYLKPLCVVVFYCFFYVSNFLWLLKLYTHGSHDIIFFINGNVFFLVDDYFFSILNVIFVNINISWYLFWDMYVVRYFSIIMFRLILTRMMCSSIFLWHVISS